MLFYEPLFLLIFFPATLLLFLTIRRFVHGRGAVLLLASLAFYGWSEPLFVPVVLATCASDYVLARPAARGSRLALFAGIAINMLMLSYYKYSGFAISNLNSLLDAGGLPLLQVIAVALPIGVSFITFEKISYLVDVYRGVSRPAPGFFAYLLYVFLFPKLLAGPIIKYHELEEQLRQFGTNRVGDVAEGLRRFMLGMVKKVLVADPLGVGADMTFGFAPEQLGCADAWWGLILFTFQIYVDFSGYSDMAIGLARVFGFRLRENFDFPYLACSITEFWRRWHISLSSWVREYLYLPLGGNRVPVWRRYINLWVCFLLSGLWHGAAWNFVLWGAYNGVFLVLDRLFLLRWLGALPRAAANAITFAVVVGGWLLFRAPSPAHALGFVGTLIDPSRVTMITAFWRMPPVMVALGVAAAGSFLPWTPGYGRAVTAAGTVPGRVLLDLMLSVLFVLSLAQALADPFRPFLYFRF